MLRAFGSKIELSMVEKGEAVRMVEGVSGVLLRLADSKCGEYSTDPAMFEMLAAVLDDATAAISADGLDGCKVVRPEDMNAGHND